MYVIHTIKIHSEGRPSGAQPSVARRFRSLDAWARQALARNHVATGTMEYMLKRWSAFTSLTEDGRICLSNNAASGSRGCSVAPIAAATVLRWCTAW